jgi:hypothetical protein
LQIRPLLDKISTKVHMAKASLKRKLLRTGIVLFCLAIPFFVWRLWVVWAVDSQLARIRAAGLPTNGDEVNKWYAAVPENENAALVLTEAFKLRRNYADSRSNLVWDFKLPPRGRSLSPDDTELLTGYVEMNGPALAKADVALKLPRSRYPIDCSLCSQTPLPHLTWLKNLAEINHYKAVLAVAKDDTDEAARAIASILGLARTLESEPCLISELVRLKLLGIAVTALERSLNHNLNLRSLTNLSGLFAQTAQIQCLSRAFIGERAMIAPYFRVSRHENPRIYAPVKEGEGDSKDNLRPGDWGVLKVIGYYEMDLGQFLFTMGNVIELASQNLPDYDEIDLHFAKAAAASRKKKRTFSAMIFSSFAHAGVRENENLARLRLSIIALAIEQFRNQRGELPDKLDALMPGFLAEIPEDPFTGLELTYRRLAKGYLIYSVGRDRMDDGGKEAPAEKPARGDSGYDLTFTVER